MVNQMKTLTKTILAILALGLAGISGCEQSEALPPAATAPAVEAASSAPPTMEMTTEIPADIAIADTVETSIGTLTFDDGFPTEETAQKVYDQLDFQRAVEAVMMTTPGASVHAFAKANRELGPDNQAAIIWPRMDSKVQLLTPNTTVIYLFLWLELSDGPMVMEVPPNVLGIVDDHWFKYVADVGMAGKDQGKGGKYVFLPPAYEGDVPDDYFVERSTTYGNWLVMRGFLENGDPAPGLKNIKDHFKLYPLGKTDADSKVTYYDMSMKYLNTIHASDITFFDHINEIVQHEPNAAQDPEILGLLSYIGIEKGKPFEPDARMQKILTDAANVGSAASRVVLYRSRDPEALVYPNSGWERPWVGNSSTFERDGVRLLDARTRFHMYATGITPSMVNPQVGKGTQYIAGMRDSKGNPLDGGKTYKVHLPANVPARQFWAFTIYNVQTRSMLQTDQRFPEISSNKESLKQNSDGTYDVYFGPTPPEGWEENWIQTVPDMGWHMLFRLYGPEQAWFDNTWRPSEIELVQ